MTNQAVSLPALPAPADAAGSAVVPMNRDPMSSLSLADTLRLGEVLARSGYFKDARDASQAVVKILYGRELGVGAVSSLMGIHIIEGKPAPSANLLGAIVKRSRRYDYRVVCHTDVRAEIAFFENAEEVGRSIWTIEDAVRAELAGRGTWKKYPRQMLFSRCLSEGVRLYAPDLFGGAAVYTPEELGAEVDGETGEPLRVALPQVNRETGEVIDVTSRVTGAAEQHERFTQAQGLKPPTIGDVRKRIADLMGKVGVPADLLQKPKVYFEQISGFEIAKLADLSLEDWLQIEQVLEVTLEAKLAAFKAYNGWCKREGHDARDRDFRLRCFAEKLDLPSLATSAILTPVQFGMLAEGFRAPAEQPVTEQVAETVEAPYEDPFADE